MKTILAFVSVVFLSVSAASAAIDGFTFKWSSGISAYTVPVGKIVVLQQLAFASGTAAGNANLMINSTSVNVPSATNGLYVLPKALFLPAGTTLYATTAVTFFGVIIDKTDAPLFVGGGSSLGNVAFVDDTMTGELQLATTASSKVIFQSSADLENWDYDTSVVMLRSTDKTKVRFTVPTAGEGRYYRALVRRADAS